MSASPASAPSRKGVVLAGGTGSRLYPLTAVLNKHLLPIYDKPMIYYPLTTLMLAGIRDIVIVSSPAALPQLRACLGTGAQWGIELGYVEQPAPKGIVDALLVAAGHLGDKAFTLVLGDNIFYRTGLPTYLQRAAARERGATIFAYPVSDPRQFGVVVLDGHSRPVAIEEKPRNPSSNLAVPGLYFYDGRALGFARGLRPSGRGEIEITDLNRIYLERGELFVERLGRGSAWLDGGTPEQLHDASDFVRVMEERTGLKISCPEEVAYRMGFITQAELASTLHGMRDCPYRSYVATLLDSVEPAHHAASTPE
jgi:glucose-1-phosphate thymidylyltransferase